MYYIDSDRHLQFFYLQCGIRSYRIVLILINTIYTYTVRGIEVKLPKDMPNESNINKIITPLLWG